jgi:hypothetical protein
MRTFLFDPLSAFCAPSRLIYCTGRQLWRPVAHNPPKEIIMSERLSGIYSANDHGFYYARFVPDIDGGSLFWYGEHPERHFANVMKGTVRSIAGSTDLTLEDGSWWDVPKGNGHGGASDPTRPDTELDLHFEANRIGKHDRSGIEFGGSNWTKIGGRPRRAPVVLESGPTEGLTGIWRCNDGGIYYIRQKGSDVVWFGQQCAPVEQVPAFANVFVGSLSGTRISGSWADVPYGEANGAGTLRLSVAGGELRRTEGAGFGGSLWSRVSIGGESMVGSVSVSLTCGGDDLRSGSVIYGSVELTDGRVVGRTSLNHGNGVGSGQTFSSDIALAPSFSVQRSDLAALILEWDGAPRRFPDGYDNFNVDRIVAGFKLPASECASVLAERSGAPVKRFTGSDTLLKVPLGV